MLDQTVIQRAKKLFSPPLVLFVAALAVYSVTFGFELLATWDDKLYLIRNETIKAVTLAHIKEAFTNYYLGNYAPLHVLSYMLDHSLWGLHPAGYHAENVLLHGVNGVLVYQFLRRIDASRTYTAIAAWIFLFHPVQVETVAWVSQRKNLLAMFFFLLALLSYQAYRQREKNRIHAYILALCWTTAAVLCKSVAVIIPVVVLLYDLTLSGESPRTLRSRLPDKIPFVLIATLTAVMAILSQSPEYGGGRRDYYGGSALATVYTMAPVLVSYLKDCFWPFDLIPFYYMIDVRMTPDISFISSVSILALVAGFGVWLHRHMKHLLFWYGLFFIALLPVMQIVPLITLKHDRYLYFPMLGFAVLTTGLVRHAGSKLPTPFRHAAACLLAAVLIMLPFAAFQQTLHWRNDVTLWSRAVAVEPENRLGWRLLSMAYTMRGDSANASIALNRYMELFNRAGTVHYYEEQY